MVLETKDLAEIRDGFAATISDDDSRLSDDRMPLEHDNDKHSEEYITNEQFTPVVTPQITLPADMTEDYAGAITSSAFAVLGKYNGLHAFTRWQLALDTTGANIIYDSLSASNLASWQPAYIHELTWLYVRCLYKSYSFASEWSDWVSFKTPAAELLTPTVGITGGTTSISKTPTIYTSSLGVTLGQTDTHVSTDWEGRDDEDTLVFSSYADTTNKTSITIPGASELSGGETHKFSARHNGDTYGQSAWGHTYATTIEDWANNTIYTNQEIDDLINIEGYIPINTPGELAFVLSIDNATRTFGFNTDWETSLYSSYASRESAKFLLLSSLDVSAEGNLIGLGVYGSFTGIFDGAGMVVENLGISSSLSYAGMFGYADGAEIKNIGLKNVNITGGKGSGSYRIATGLVGMAFGGTSIKNCFVTGQVEGYIGVETEGFYATGSVVGIAWTNADIENCFALCSVVGDSHSGGFAGRAINCSLVDCWSGGKVFLGNGSAGKGFYGDYADDIDLTMTGNYLDTEASGASQSEWTLVTARTTAQMLELTQAGTGWDAGVWTFEDHHYPYLTAFGKIDGIEQNIIYELV